MISAAVYPFLCSKCGAGFEQYTPDCVTCGASSTVRAVRRVAPTTPASASASAPSARRRLVDVTLRTDAPPMKRMSTGVPTIDRLLGGGIVIDAGDGSALYLLAGNGGSGKSTLALLLASLVPGTLYAVAEGSLAMWNLLSTRLFAENGRGVAVPLTFTKDIGEILDEADARRPPLVIVDQLHSLEPMGHDLANLKALYAFSERTHCTVLVLAEREKGGTVRGVGSLEHQCDAVLYIEQVSAIPSDGGVTPSSEELQRRWLTVRKSRLGECGSAELALTRKGWADLPAKPSDGAPPVTKGPSLRLA